MLRFVMLVALLAAAAYVLVNRVASNPLSPQLTRREVTVQSRLNEVRFQRGLPLDDAYMLFGGNSADQSGHFVNVLLSGIAQRHVSLISQRYPDFTQCRSPGAASAKQAIEHMGLIGRNGRARNTLLEALRLHELGSNPERLSHHASISFCGAPLTRFLAEHGLALAPRARRRLQRNLRRYDPAIPTPYERMARI